MIIKALGILDIIAAAIFFIHNAFFHSMPDSIIWIAAFYLIAKGVVFLLSVDIASIIDIICGLLIIMSIHVTLFSGLAILIAVYLIGKGALSLVG